MPTPPRLRRQRTPARDPADARPTLRQHLRTSATRTHPRSPHWPEPTTLQARPGHRRQGLQLPRFRSYLRKRGIAHTIPEKADQQRHRYNRGRHGGRPPGFDRQIYRQRNMIERCFNRLKGFPPASPQTGPAMIWRATEGSSPRQYDRKASMTDGGRRRSEGVRGARNTGSPGRGRRHARHMGRRRRGRPAHSPGHRRQRDMARARQRAHHRIAHRSIQ
jgi:hypothetical protein